MFWFITVTGLPQFHGAGCTSVVWAPLGPPGNRLLSSSPQHEEVFACAEGAEPSHGNFIKRFILLQMLLPPERLHAPWQLCWWKGPLPAGGSPAREPHLCPLPFWWIPAWALPLQPPAPQVHTSGLLHHCHMPEPVGGPQRVWEVGLLHLGHHQIREDPREPWQGPLPVTCRGPGLCSASQLCRPPCPGQCLFMWDPGEDVVLPPDDKGLGHLARAGAPEMDTSSPLCPTPRRLCSGRQSCSVLGGSSTGHSDSPLHSSPGQPSPLSARRLLLPGSLSGPAQGSRVCGSQLLRALHILLDTVPSLPHPSPSAHCGQSKHWGLHSGTSGPPGELLTPGREIAHP